MAADYTNSEILNELSRIFRVGIDPGREGGTLNTQVEYGQLLDTASLTFLLQNDAIFYLARLVRNTLNSLVVQEIRLLEDTLLALDHLGKIGAPVRDTTILSNANTALLALDAAGSVQNRPESARFSKQMDSFAGLNRTNVVTGNELVRPKEEARGIIAANLTSLKKVHTKVLDSTYALRDLLDEYLDLDIPSKVSSTAISNIRSNLEDIEEDIPDSTNADNIAASRKSVLTALASKVAVDAIANFSDPRTVKVRSPSNPYPTSLKHFGRVTGTGDPASVTSSQGPWSLPLSAPLVLAVDGGANVQVDVDQLLGTTLRAKAEEPFALSAGVSGVIKLHMLVDPRIVVTTAGAGSTVVTSILGDHFGLGFKNLGAPISFPNMAGTDVATRVIQDLRGLQFGTVSAAVNLGGEKWRVTFSGWAGGDEPGGGMTQDHVGSYFRDGSFNRWEILVVEDTNNAVVSVPTITPAPVNPPSTGSLTLSGDVPSLTTKLTFTPATTATTLNEDVQISAAIKTVTLSIAPDNDVAGVIVDVQSEQADVDVGLLGNAWRLMTLNQHVQVKADPLNPTRLVFTARSSVDPTVLVAAQFVRVNAALTVSIVEDSAHTALGLLIGQSMAEHRLSPVDLAEFVESSVPGLSSSVSRETIATGILNTVSSTAQVTAPELDGVAEVGDQLVLGGVESGTFSIESLSPITLDRSSFSSSEVGVPYKLKRTTATLASANNSRGSSLGVVSGPSELGFSVGTVYGSLLGFEAVDKSGNLLDFGDLASAGDILDIAGLSDVAIDNVNSTTLTLVSGLASNVARKAFEIRSVAAVAYNSLAADLETYASSRQLLQKHGFDVDLDELDVALTRALLPGQNFTSNRNQAKQVAADLLSIMTSSPRRTDEYTTDIPVAALDLETLLSTFSPGVVSEVDSLLDTFLERKYGRSVKLLQSGKIREFFATNEETGSHAGAMMSASRQVVRDMPAQATTDEEVDASVNLYVTTSVGVDPEYNLDDSEVIDAGRNR